MHTHIRAYMPTSLCLQVIATVRCTATGPYGLQSTLEYYMSEAAYKSVNDFLQFCTSYVAGLAAAPGALPALPMPPEALAEPDAFPALAAPTYSPSSLRIPSREDDSPFFDVDDEPAVSTPKLGAPLEDEAILLYLRYLCRTGDENAALLQALEVQLQQVCGTYGFGRVAALEREHLL
jgi:hypothetical protein